MNALQINLEKFEIEMKFDLVVATDVLEHIQDDSSFLSHMKRHCKAGGRFVITVPALSYLYGYPDEILGHYRRYSIQQFCSLLKTCMEITWHRYYGVFLLPAAFLFSRLIKRPYPLKEIEGNESKTGVLNRVIVLLLKIEKKVYSPIGVSLLAIGKNQ